MDFLNKLLQRTSGGGNSPKSAGPLLSKASEALEQSREFNARDVILGHKDGQKEDVESSENHMVSGKVVESTEPEPLEDGDEEETFEDAKENKLSLTALAEDLEKIHLTTPCKSDLIANHEFNDERLYKEGSLDLYDSFEKSDCSFEKDNLGRGHTSIADENFSNSYCKDSVGGTEFSGDKDKNVQTPENVLKDENLTLLIKSPEKHSVISGGSPSMETHVGKAELESYVINPKNSSLDMESKELNSEKSPGIQNVSYAEEEILQSLPEQAFENTCELDTLPLSPYKSQYLSKNESKLSQPTSTKSPNHYSLELDVSPCPSSSPLLTPRAEEVAGLQQGTNELSGSTTSTLEECAQADSEISISLGNSLELKYLQQSPNVSPASNQTIVCEENSQSTSRTSNISTLAMSEIEDVIPSLGESSASTKNILKEASVTQLSLNKSTSTGSAIEVKYTQQSPVICPVSDQNDIILETLQATASKSNNSSPPTSEVDLQQNSSESSPAEVNWQQNSSESSFDRQNALQVEYVQPTPNKSMSFENALELKQLEQSKEPSPVINKNNLELENVHATTDKLQASFLDKPGEEIKQLCLSESTASTNNTLKETEDNTQPTHDKALSIDIALGLKDASESTVISPILNKSNIETLQLASDKFEAYISSASEVELQPNSNEFGPASISSTLKEDATPSKIKAVQAAILPSSDQNDLPLESCNLASNEAQEVPQLNQSELPSSISNSLEQEQPTLNKSSLSVINVFEGTYVEQSPNISPAFNENNVQVEKCKTTPKKSNCSISDMSELKDIQQSPIRTNVPEEHFVEKDTHITESIQDKFEVDNQKPNQSSVINSFEPNEYSPNNDLKISSEKSASVQDMPLVNKQVNNFKNDEGSPAVSYLPLNSNQSCLIQANSDHTNQIKYPSFVEDSSNSEQPSSEKVATKCIALTDTESKNKTDVKLGYPSPIRSEVPETYEGDIPANTNDVCEPDLAIMVDSIEFDQRIADEAVNISDELLNHSQEITDSDSENDQTVLSVADKICSNPSLDNSKSPMFKIPYNPLEFIKSSPSKVIKKKECSLRSGVSKSNKDEELCESLFQSMRPVLAAHLNQSEAGPITADEFADNAFQDGATLDLDYLTSVGGTGSLKESLTRESLYVKFDPIVGAIVSASVNEKFTMPPPVAPEEDQETKIKSEEDGEPASQCDESEAAGLSSVAPRTPLRSPALEVVQKLISLTPSSAPAPAAQTVSPVKPDRTTTVRKVERSPAVPASSSPKNASVSPEMQKMLKKLEADLQEREKDFANLLSKNKQLEVNLRSSLEREKSLKKDVQEKTKSKQQLSLVIEEYEKTISQLVAQKEEEKKAFEVQKSQLMQERDTTTQHLNNMEIAFNDIHQKYERGKSIIEGMKSNEDRLKQSLAEYDEAIKSYNTKYENLKTHAIRQLETANQELDLIRRNHQAEVAKLKAMLKKAEVKATSFEESLEQKTKENQELAAICDELINKVGNN